METSQSCRGHPGYKNYKPYAIVVKQRVAKWGFMRARIGRPQLASWIIPICAVQIVASWYSQMVYRRNRKFMMDEHREVHRQLNGEYSDQYLQSDQPAIQVQARQ